MPHGPGRDQGTGQHVVTGRGQTGPSADQAPRVQVAAGPRAGRAGVRAGWLPPGAHLGRYAYFLAAAPTPSDCALALNVATELVDLRYEPLEAEPLAGRPW